MNLKTFFPLLIVLILVGLVNCNSLTKSTKMGDDFYAYLQDGTPSAFNKILEKTRSNLHSKKNWTALIQQQQLKYGPIQAYRRVEYKTQSDKQGVCYILDYLVSYEQQEQQEQLTFIKTENDYELLDYQVKSVISSLEQ